MRVFLDANIIFSAANPNSPIRQLLEFLNKKAILITHPFALEEAQLNLINKKPYWLAGYESLEKKMKIANETVQVLGIPLHEKDYPILCASVGSKCSHLLTGDFKHFGHLFGKIIHGVKIISAKMLVEEMKERGWL